MKTIAIILLANFSLVAQNPLYDSIKMYNEFFLLQRFDSVKYFHHDSYKEFGVVRCPWQSWKTVPCNHIQIDIVLNYEALRALWNDKTILVEDLWKLFHEMPLEFLETWKRGYKVQVYKALFYPAYEKYDILDTDYVLASFIHPSHFPNPDQKWTRRAVRGAIHGMGRLPIAIQRLPDRGGEKWWIFSAAMFIERHYRN